MKIYLYDNLKYIDTDMKMQELERQVGVSRGYFSRKRKDETEEYIPFATLHKLSQILGIKIDTLMLRDLKSEHRKTEICYEIERLKAELNDIEGETL